jgi:Zn-dependent protease with chaperone function
MYLFLGISILLAPLLALNSAVTMAAAGLWRLVENRGQSWSAASRARIVFLLRTIPGATGITVVLVLLAPAYVVNEPRSTPEVVSAKLALLALISALGIALAIIRVLGSWRATHRLAADWKSKGQKISLAAMRIPTYRIAHRFPVIAVVGTVKPRLFIATQVLDSLSADEIAAALAHEQGHLAKRDNLKRGLLRACRDALLIIPSGRSLDRAWADASEEAADEFAARAGRKVALDLASALVKIARMVPPGAKPMMPAGAFLLSDEETRGVKTRVRRLLELAANYQPCDERRVASSSWVVITALVLIPTVAFFVRGNSHVLGSVHSLIEEVVFLLR